MNNFLVMFEIDEICLWNTPQAKSLDKPNFVQKLAFRIQDSSALTFDLKNCLIFTQFSTFSFFQGTKFTYFLDQGNHYQNKKIFTSMLLRLCCARSKYWNNSSGELISSTDKLVTRIPVASVRKSYAVFSEGFRRSFFSYYQYTFYIIIK